MRYLIVIIILLISVPLYGSTHDTAEIMELYNQARDMFRKANELAAIDSNTATDLYQKSAMRFEKIVWQGGIKNGKIFYNIGNAYFKMGDIGKAILNYKRANQYIPNDLNLRQNLQSAKAKRIDKIDEPQRTQVLKILFFWHYDFSTQTRVILFTACFILVWIFAALRLFISRQYLTWYLFVAIGLTFLFSTSLVTEMIYQQKIRPGVIISSEVIARKGDSSTYVQSFKEPLHAGTEFLLIEKRGTWYNIELLDSRQCWVPHGDVELVTPSP